MDALTRRLRDFAAKVDQKLDGFGRRLAEVAPPVDLTGYYTKAQVDELIAGLGSAGPTVTFGPLTAISLTVDAAFARTFTASGGTSPYSYAVASGALPAGIILSGSSITGTPTAEGAFAFGIRATDANGYSSPIAAFAGTVEAEIVVTPPSDATPDAFTFADVASATPGAAQTSNTITVSGINAPTPMSVTGGVYYKNGGAASAVSTTVVVGDTVSVGHTASGSNSTATNTTLTIGGVSDTFTSTTVAAAGGFPAAESDFGAPEASRTSGATAYPVTVDPTFLPSEHMVGDTLRVVVASAVQDSAGLLLPSGTAIRNDTITLIADAATNRTNLNAKLAGIAAGVGFVFLRTERGALASSWSIPVQYGTAAVPAITSALTFCVTEGQPLAYTATTAAPVRAVYIVGQDGDRVEFTGAKPGSTFPLRFTGGVTKTFPADDFNTDNVYDIGFEVIGLNGVSSGVQAFALTLLDLDLEADAFNFADVADVPLGAYGRSPTTITVSGLTPGYTVPLSLGAGVRVQINGGAYVTSGNVQQGDTLNAEVLTPGTAASTAGTVNYGGKTDTFRAFGVGYVAPAGFEWSTTSKNADVAVSGKTATFNGGGIEGVRSTIALPTTGKIYVELLVTGAVNTSTIGIINSAATFAEYLGSNANGYTVLLQDGDAQLFTGNVKTKGVGAGTSPAVIGLALDMDAKLFAARSGSGAWNDETADIANVTTRKDFSALGSTLYLGAASDVAGTIVLRTLASEMTRPIPAGYTTLEV